MSMRPSITEQTRSIPSASGEWSKVFRHSYSLPAEKAQPIQNASRINAIEPLSHRVCFINQFVLVLCVLFKFDWFTGRHQLGIYLIKHTIVIGLFNKTIIFCLVLRMNLIVQRSIQIEY
jgi:hypothetical protein